MRTHFGRRLHIIASHVSKTISPTVDLPSPNRTANVLSYTFVPSLHMVTATLNLNTDRDPELGCLPFKVRSQFLTKNRKSVMRHSEVLFPECSNMNASYNLTPPFLASLLAPSGTRASKKFTKFIN